MHLTKSEVVRVASGNFLEMYDFQVFGYFAVAIGQAYFPADGEFGSLLKALATFGVGFLMRPVGAIVLGGFTDRHGRRAGLLLTLGLMSIGIVILTVTPGYATLGVLASLIVLAGRLIQGFSAGAELGGASVYLAEMAPPHRKGFYVAWQSTSQQVSVIAAALIGIALTAMLSPAQLTAWGWRVPLAFGCLLVPLLLILRRDLRESDAFDRTVDRSTRDIARIMWRHRRRVVVGLALVLMTTVIFYLITAYTPTYGKLLGLSERDGLLVTALVGVSNILWLPPVGALTDRIGRRPVLIVCTALTLLTAYPAMAWLAHAPSLGRLIAVDLWFSALFASYNGALVVYLTEYVPAEARVCGFSLAWSLATAVGGFSPFIVTWAIGVTGNHAIPGAWVTLVAAISLIAVISTRSAGEPGRVEGANFSPAKES